MSLAKIFSNRLHALYIILLFLKHSYVYNINYENYETQLGPLRKIRDTRISTTNYKVRHLGRITYIFDIIHLRRLLHTSASGNGENRKRKKDKPNVDEDAI